MPWHLLFRRFTFPDRCVFEQILVTYQALTPLELQPSQGTDLRKMRN